MEELHSLLDRAREAHARGDLAKAERLFLESLDKGAASYADAHHALGVIYHAWGLFSKARAAFEEALRLNPKYTEAALNLSITYNDLGRYAESRELMERSAPSKAGGRLDELSRSKIANLHATLGDAYRSAGLPAEAAVEYRRALGLCPQFVDIRTRLAATLTDQGRRGEALEELRLALLEKEDYVPAMLQLALLAAAEGQAAEAKRTLEAVLERAPGHPRAIAYLRMLEPRGESA